MSWVNGCGQRFSRASDSRQARAGERAAQLIKRHGANNDRNPTVACFYLTPNQDDSNQELQICIAEALYDVDSIVADPGAYTDLTQSDRV